MGRRLRHHLPGTAFHLTSRVQGRGPLLAGIEPAAIAAIRRATRRSDVRLLAWAIMPNHLHIVLIQGRLPLSAYMQPLMRRLAWLVAQLTSHEGHVFERRFHSTPCSDAFHLRNAIAYTHLNPVRAGHCATPDLAAATTHQWYAGSGGQGKGVPPELHAALGLRMFAPTCPSSEPAHVDAYREFMDWRVQADAAHRLGTLAPVAPSCSGGNIYWRDELCRWPDAVLPGAQLDLRDLALRVVEEVAPGLPLDTLRGADRSAAVVRVRDRFILRARDIGHSGVRIAEFLGISSSAVSAAALRAAAPSSDS